MVASFGCSRVGGQLRAAAHCGSTATRPWPASMASQAAAASVSFSDMNGVGIEPRRSRLRDRLRPSMGKLGLGGGIWLVRDTYLGKIVHIAGFACVECRRSG